VLVWVCTVRTSQRNLTFSIEGIYNRGNTIVKEYIVASDIIQPPSLYAFVDFIAFLATDDYTITHQDEPFCFVMFLEMFEKKITHWIYSHARMTPIAL